MEIIKHLITVLKKTANDDIPTIFLEALKRVCTCFFFLCLLVILHSMIQMILIICQIDLDLSSMMNDHYAFVSFNEK